MLDAVESMKPGSDGDQTIRCIRLFLADGMAVYAGSTLLSRPYEVGACSIRLATRPPRLGPCLSCPLLPGPVHYQPRPGIRSSTARPVPSTRSRSAAPRAPSTTTTLGHRRPPVAAADCQPSSPAPWIQMRGLAFPDEPAELLHLLCRRTKRPWPPVSTSPRASRHKTAERSPCIDGLLSINRVTSSTSAMHCRNPKLPSSQAQTA